MNRKLIIRRLSSLGLVLGFAFLLGQGLFAQENYLIPALPSELSSINELIREVKNPISLKLSDLKKNYRLRRKGNSLEFSSHQETTCHGEVRAEESVLARLDYRYRSSGERHVHSLRLYDCRGELRLEEELVIKKGGVGGKRSALAFESWSEGRLDYELKDDEERLLYRLKDAQGISLLELQGRQEQRGQIYEIKVLSQRILQVRYDFLAGQSRAFYSFYGRDLKYRYKKSFGVSMNSHFDSFAYKVYASTDEVRFFNAKNVMISLNSFLSYFNIYALDLGLRQLKSIVDFHLSFLPSTEVIISSGPNSDFLEELRLNLNRLLNGINLNLLELFIRDLIQAVEDGLLIDRRES